MFWKDIRILCMISNWYYRKFKKKHCSNCNWFSDNVDYKGEGVFGWCCFGSRHPDFQFGYITLEKPCGRWEKIRESESEEKQEEAEN